MSNAENPYASPQAAIEPQAAKEVEFTEAESIRCEHINHEASVRSIGSLLYLAAIVPSFAILGFLSARQPVFAVAAGAIAALVVGLGTAVRKLEPWTRIPVAIVALLGIPLIPFGPIVSIYALYLVLGRKGRFIFSPEYAKIVLETPNVKYRTPATLKVIVALVFLAILCAVLLPPLLLLLLGRGSEI